MGKASSAKKVARAARTGGKSTSRRKNLGFPAAVTVVVLLGVGLVLFARGTTQSGGAPELGDHWHAAFGVFICDRWVADLADRGPDQLGIHTHEDGLIHIHPFLAGSTGKAATLGKFFDQVGMSASSSSITLPEGGQFEGRKYVSGETTCGDEPGEVRLAFWENSQETGDGPTEVFDSGISGQHLGVNFAAFTLAFVPEGAEIPPPPSAEFIVERAVVDGGEGQPIQGVPEQTDLPSDSTVPAGESPGGGGLEVPAQAEVSPSEGEGSGTDGDNGGEAPASEEGEAPPSEGGG